MRSCGPSRRCSRGSNVRRDLLSLEAAGSSPVALVGGKARTLGVLHSAGFKVPSGVVVPGEVSLEEASWSTLGGGPFAVRSSGVAEDGADSSLAGRYESKLDVELGSVLSAVKQVREFARRKDGATIPVLVQAMVAPLVAGVAFTANPVTGDRSTTVVTATSGLADRLVAGHVEGDEWHLNGSSTRRVRTAEGVLSKRMARRVAGLAKEIAHELGSPQDVEWAWDGAELWVVQSRPITGLGEDVTWDPPVPGIFSRTLRFGEWIPEPVTPLFESWLLTRMERRVHDYLRAQVGQVAPEPLHVVVNGWYYYSLNWAPVPGVAFTRNLVRILPRLPWNWRKVAGMFPQTARHAYQEFEEEWRTELLPRYRSEAARAEDMVDSADSHGLVELVDDLADLSGDFFASIAVVAGSAYKMEAQLAQFWNRHLRDEIGGSHVPLLLGLEQAAEAGAPRLETLDWWRPAAAPGEPPPELDDLRKRRVETERRARHVLASSRRKTARFERILADAQHLAPVREEQVSQLALTWPVMRRAVLRLGENLVEIGSISSPGDVFFLKREELVTLLEGGDPMHDLVASRHDARDRASRLSAPLTVGRVPRLIRFMFEMSGKILGASRSEDAIVHGIPASPGRATGPVRIVRDSSQFEDLLDGEVLVAPLTAPAWTDLFDRASAVVTDVGSALAHASIIAREYGIPAVVGCGDATSKLTNGQVVTVDGTTGNIEPAHGRGPSV
jgi:phosphohistidine swiveling domain-containing protein